MHHFDHSVTNRPGADSVLLLLSLVSRTLCRPNKKVNVGHKLRPNSAAPVHSFPASISSGIASD